MAYAPINPTQITPPRVAFLDDRTGAISREWFRFLLSLQDAAQTSLDASTLPPDTNSLVASYSELLNTLAQEMQSQPACASPDDVAVLQTQIMDLELEPPCATLDEVASLQTQIVDLELEPPCASIEDVSVLQTQAQDLAESILPDPQTFLLPVWSALQDLALAPSVIVPTASAAAGAGTVTSVDVSGGATGFAFAGGPVTSSGTITMSVSNAATARTALGLATIAATGDAADLTGNLAVARFNSGTAASSTTFWRGDGVWGTPVVSILNDNATAGPVYPLFFTGTGSSGTLYQSDGGLAYFPSTGGLRTTLHRFPATSTTTVAQTASEVTVAGRAWASRTMPTVREGTGAGYAQAPHPAHRRIAQAQFGAGTSVGTVAALVGHIPYTAVSPGTPTVVNPTAALPFMKTGLVTAGTSGSIASWRGTGAPIIAGAPFFVVFRFGTVNGFGFTGLVFNYVGLVDVTTAPTSVDPTAAGSTTPGRLGIGMNNISSGALRIVNNLSGTAPTTTALTGGGASTYTNASGFFELTLWSDGTNYYWQTAIEAGIGVGFIAAVNSGTFSSNRPASGTLLYPVAWVSNNGAGSAETLQLVSITRETEA